MITMCVVVVAVIMGMIVITMIMWMVMGMVVIMRVIVIIMMMVMVVRYGLMSLYLGHNFSPSVLP
jgi:hypothetical protein